MAATVTLVVAASGCDGDVTHRGIEDGGLAHVDQDARLGFRDASTVAPDDSGTSTEHSVNEDAALSDGGSGGDAPLVAVCGDGTCETGEADSCPRDCDAECGGTACVGAKMCHDGATCAVPAAGITLIYATNDEYDGDLGGRSGADRICRDDLPAELSCGPPMALLSVAAGDSVAALSRERLTEGKRLYAYDRGTNGLTLLADDWTHALNAHSSPAPGLYATMRTGTGAIFSSFSGFWSGSQADGARQPDGSCGSGCSIDYTCNGWTTNVPTGSSNVYGTQGDAASTKQWIHSSANYVGCNNKMRLLCACRRQ